MTTVSVLKLVLLCAVIALAILSSRSFCRALCPIGAMLAPLNLITFWKLKLPTEGCTSCGRCARACPQEGMPQKRIAAGIPPNRALDCIVCDECGAACPQNARSKVNAEENQ